MNTRGPKLLRETNYIRNNHDLKHDLDLEIHIDNRLHLSGNQARSLAALATEVETMKKKADGMVYAWRVSPRTELPRLP